MFNLPTIPSSKELIDKAFKQGSKTAKVLRSTRAPHEKRMRKSEEQRVEIVGKEIEIELRTILKRFPQYDDLSEFHKRLLDIKVDKDRYKHSLGAVNWCARNVSQLRRESLRDMKGRRDSTVSMAFLGRAASMVKRISKDLDELAKIKAILKEFPTIEDIPTAVVSGYPNVGKSTFMRNLTGSDVKVASYPFTTQSILIGHTMLGHMKYQVIDSPGLLDRPMEERNEIELQAVLAIKELADVVIFIIDPTIDAGPQLSLLKDIKEKFETRIVVAVNKIDAAEKEGVESIVRELAGYTVYTISANDKEDCQRVFRDIWKKENA